MIGKSGRMRKEYLQEKNPMLLNNLIFREQPFPHLLAIYETTHCGVEKLMTELLKRNQNPKKATYQMA